METVKRFKKILTMFSVGFLFLFFVKDSDAQVNLKISDNGNLAVSSGTYLKVPGNLTIGNGTSGTLKMNGISSSVSGQLILNSGSNLILTNENLSFGTKSIDANSTVTYNGTDENVFNWNYGNLVFSGSGTMSITGDATTPTVCNNLTVNNTGNVLKIPEAKALTVNSVLTNNAGTSSLVIESSAAGDGSLISYTSGVNATVKRYLTGYRWHYISSPIDAAPISLFNTNNFMWWDASLDWAGTGDYNPWQGFTGSNLINAQGYAYYYYETTIPFQGEINVDDYNITLHMYNSGNLDYQGWNLIGNPYSSILDWDAAVAGGAVPSGAENAIYFFDDDDGSGSQSNYRYYVPSSGGTYGIGTADANGKIPIGQGFFIKTNTDNVNLVLSKNYRTHDVQEFYKNDNNEFFKIQISGSYTDETIVRILNNSTFGFDPNSDARKLFPSNDQIPQVFIVGTDNKNIAINSVPDVLPETKINLGINALKGEYILNLNDYNFDRYDIYLVDSYLKSYTNLNNSKTYKFHHSGGLDVKRFYITFKEPSSEIESISNTLITVYPNPTSQFIKFKNNSNAEFESVKINTADGKICYLNNQPQLINEIDLSKFSNGVYFLEIKLSDGNTYRNRIILKK